MPAHRGTGWVSTCKVIVISFLANMLLEKYKRHHHETMLCERHRSVNAIEVVAFNEKQEGTHSDLTDADIAGSTAKRGEVLDHFYSDCVCKL